VGVKDLSALFSFISRSCLQVRQYNWALYAAVLMFAFAKKYYLELQTILPIDPFQ
jgi:hypothetical protein